jgi:hypothetical protein
MKSYDQKMETAQLNLNVKSASAPLYRKSANSLYDALDLLVKSNQPTLKALLALKYLEFVYAGEIAHDAFIIRNLLLTKNSKLKQNGITKAVSSIQKYMERWGSFPYPLNRAVDDDRLIVEALDVLQEALDQSLDKDMQTQKVREALRFLVWKDGKNWEYVCFWNALSFNCGRGNWQNADVALKNIRKVFN